MVDLHNLSGNDAHDGAQVVLVCASMVLMIIHHLLRRLALPASRLMVSVLVNVQTGTGIIRGESGRV